MRQARIGVFGGTFDPVHVGHLILAAEFRHELGLDRLLFVPAGRPPHKTPAEVSDDVDRLAMLRLAVADNPAFEISLRDLERTGPSYTADLLTTLNGELAPATLVFLMGADSLNDLPNWHDPNRIATLAELGVASRPDVTVDLDSVFGAVPTARGRVRIITSPLIGISSSDLRRRVRDGEPIRYQVPRGVEEYIRSHGLYQR